MRSSTVAKALLILGAFVGGLAGLALALGFRLDRLPPWMITVGMYKLAFIASAGLFVAGALLGRALRGRQASAELSKDAQSTQAGIGPGAWPADDTSIRQGDRPDRDRRHN